MKYKTKTLPLLKIMLHKHGPISPLCNHCKTQDCTHQIEKKKISVFGVNKSWRVMAKGVDSHIVYECEGFSD